MSALLLLLVPEPLVLTTLTPLLTPTIMEWMDATTTYC